jgi:hypothetical protein
LVCAIAGAAEPSRTKLINKNNAVYFLIFFIKKIGFGSGKDDRETCDVPINAARRLHEMTLMSLLFPACFEGNRPFPDPKLAGRN